MSAETNVEDFAIGDTVEIKLRAKVMSVSKWSDMIEVETEAGRNFLVPENAATLVERPVKVGDEVNGKQAIKLPIGSVVVYEPGGGASLKVNDTEWVSTSERTPQPFVPTWFDTTLFKVLHIGGPDRRVKA